MSGIYDKSVSQPFLYVFYFFIFLLFFFSAFPICFDVGTFSFVWCVGVSKLASESLSERLAACVTIHLVYFWQEGSSGTPVFPTWSALTLTDYFYLQPTRNKYHENGDLLYIIHCWILVLGAILTYNTRLISTSSLIMLTKLKGKKMLVFQFPNSNICFVIYWKTWNFREMCFCLPLIWMQSIGLQNV